LTGIKITSLGQLLAASLADGDELVIVDVSDTSQASSGTTKRITSADFLEAVNTAITDTHDDAVTVAEAYTDAPMTLNAQNGDYTFALSDAGNVLVEGTKSTGQTFTIPPNSSAAFAIGSVIEVNAVGAGGVTVAAGSGVTINGSNTALAQGSNRAYYKRATDTWWGMG
jgi:hypothetical protein